LPQAITGKNKMSYTSHSHKISFRQWLVSLFVASASLALVAQSGQQSLAATYSHNPLGGADSCLLVNGQTVLYGWAYDPDSGAGANPYVQAFAGTATAKVASSISGYRDAAVNSYVQSHNPGAPANSVYGWRWTINGLYKGSSYVVKGTVLNYGAGTANDTMTVAHSNTSGMISGSHPFASNNTIPDICLAAKPVSVPAPAPAPTPAPAPAPTHTSTTTKKTTSTHTTPQPAAPAAPGAPAVPQAGEISTGLGTTSVVLSLPTAGATGISAAYGTDPQGLLQTAAATDVSGATSSVTLKGLEAKTKYYYTLSRAANGQTSTSAIGTFTTSGFTINARFIDLNKKPATGILTHLDKLQAVSDEKGGVSFEDQGDGTHTLSFSYLGTPYKQKINTADAKSSNSGEVVTIEKTINLADLKNTAGLTKGGSNGWLLMGGGIVLGLAVLALIIWMLVRRRASLPRRPANHQGDPLVATTIPSLAKKYKSSQEPLPAHAGQSLASMVMEAMQQERTANQQQTQPPAPAQTNRQDPPASDTPPTVPPPLIPPSRF
jgi:outer membrane biosynthesis protein TonB